MKLNEMQANFINDYFGVYCISGDKASRILGKVFKKYGIDENPEYKKVFAGLCHLLNPVQTTE